MTTPGEPLQEPRTRRVRRRSQRVVGHDDAVEALRDLARRRAECRRGSGRRRGCGRSTEPVAGDRPRGRQPGLHVARSLAVLDERVEHLARDQGDGALEGRGWIQDGRNGRAGRLGAGRLGLPREPASRGRASTASIKTPSRKDMESFISKRAHRDVPCARHRCSLLRHRRGRLRRLWGCSLAFTHGPGPWHQTCLLLDRVVEQTRDAPGTDAEREHVELDESHRRSRRVETEKVE